MARTIKAIEQEITDAIRAEPPQRLQPHDPEEFEVKREAIEYAPPLAREAHAAALEAAKLPVERLKRVEQGLTEYHSAYAENNQLRRDNGELKVQIASLNAHIDATEKEANVIEERVKECLRQRDEAVAEASELKGVLSSLAAILLGYFNPARHSHQSENQSDAPVADQP